MVDTATQPEADGHSDDAPGATEPASGAPSTFHAEEGQWISLSNPGVLKTSRAICEIRSATFSEFVVSVSDLPDWLAAGSELNAEINHGAGREMFLTTVLRTEPTPKGFQLVLAQPERSWRHNRRSSQRVGVDIPVRYSLLDDDQHPGVDHESIVHDLSVEGMRLDPDGPAPRGQKIVASLQLRDGWLSVLGELVVDVGADRGTQMRVRFTRMTDTERWRLVNEVANWSGTDPQNILAPQVVTHGPPRHVVEAYAGRDRRN